MEKQFKQELDPHTFLYAGVQLDTTCGKYTGLYFSGNGKFTFPVKEYLRFFSYGRFGDFFNGCSKKVFKKTTPLLDKFKTLFELAEVAT